MKNWQALKNEWTAIIVAHRDDPERCQSQLDRLVERWDGVIEDTGGGCEVGYVRWRSQWDDQMLATINDEMIVLWAGDEPYQDEPREEIFASEVIA